jgi:large subunit ribosomal protein L35
MPKIKTHKGLAKRIKVTAGGKLRHKKASGSHLMSGMSPKRRRKLGAPGFISDEFAPAIRRLLNIAAK